jgi:transcriptional regulator with XRE-family HTH domain
MIICLLSSYIRQSKYTRKEICEIFDIHTNTLSNWCRGEHYPSVPQLLKLCELLDVKVEDIYKLKGELSSERED